HWRAGRTGPRRPAPAPRGLVRGLGTRARPPPGELSKQGGGSSGSNGRGRRPRLSRDVGDVDDASLRALEHVLRGVARRRVGAPGRAHTAETGIDAWWDVTTVSALKQPQAGRRLLTPMSLGAP